MFGFFHSQLLLLSHLRARLSLANSSVPPYPQRSCLFFPRPSRPGPNFPSLDSGTVFSHNLLLACLSRDPCQSGLADTSLNPPLTLGRAHSPGLCSPVPGPFSSSLSPALAPAIVHTAGWLPFLDSSTYLVYLENTYQFFPVHPNITSSVKPSWVTPGPQTQASSGLPPCVLPVWRAGPPPTPVVNVPANSKSPLRVHCPRKPARTGAPPVDRIVLCDALCGF